MNYRKLELHQQPFHITGEPLVFVNYASQQAAWDFLQLILKDSRGTGLLYGPASSGKKTAIRKFMRRLPSRLAVAHVDGMHLKPTEFLQAILKSFGNDVDSDSFDDLLKSLVVFLLQQARNVGAPVIVIGNLSKMYPSTLGVLCKLAAIQLRGTFAVRLIMHCRTPPYAIIHAPAMNSIAVRLISAFELGPMTMNEASDYLHQKLLAAGCAFPARLLPPAACLELYRASNGWPGILDGLAMRALDQLMHKAPDEAIPPVLRPVSDTSPANEQKLQKLMVTLQGRTLFDFDLTETKILIGRSQLCDVVIDSRFVSKFHAMILKNDNSVHLIDLNSCNGTFVNSQRIQVKSLRHDDIISLGNHGIKLLSPGVRSRAVSVDLGDTVKMKTLTDARRDKLTAVQAMVANVGEESSH